MLNLAVAFLCFTVAVIFAGLAITTGDPLTVLLSAGNAFFGGINLHIGLQTLQR